MTVIFAYNLCCYFYSFWKISVLIQKTLTFSHFLDDGKITLIIIYLMCLTDYGRKCSYTYWSIFRLVFLLFFSEDLKALFNAIDWLSLDWNITISDHERKNNSFQCLCFDILNMPADINRMNIIFAQILSAC